MTDIPSDANFSLLLGDGIAWMYHHPPSGAKIPIGEVRENDGSEDLQWSVLRRRAFRLGSGRLATRVLLPEWLVNYSICYAPGPTDRERSEQIKQGLIGRTGYNENVSQLVFDWCGDGEVLQVAAVALNSLKDAADFAGAFGLNPVAYSAAPNPAKFADEPVFEFPAGRFGLPSARDADKDGRSKGSFAGSLFGKAAKLKAASAARKRGTRSGPHLSRSASFFAAASKSAAALAIAVTAGAAAAQAPPSGSEPPPGQQETVSATLYAPMRRPPLLAPAIVLRPTNLAAARDGGDPARTERASEESGARRLAENNDKPDSVPTTPDAPASDDADVATAPPAEPAATVAETTSSIALFAPQRRPEAVLARVPARTERDSEESGTQRLAENSDKPGSVPTAPDAPASDDADVATAPPAEPAATAAETASSIALFAPQRRPEAVLARAPATTAPKRRPDYLASLRPGARDAHDEFSTPITRPDVLMIGKGFSGTGRVTRNAPQGPNFVSAESAALYATEKRVLKRTRKPLLLGVFGKEGSRSALVRLGDGSIAKVSVGDQLDGGRISAISRSSLIYRKNGNTRTLAMP